MWPADDRLALRAAEPAPRGSAGASSLSRQPWWRLGSRTAPRGPNRRRIRTALAEQQSDPDIRSDEPADPNASVEPPEGPGTGAEQPANPVVRPPTRTAQQPECISNTDVMNLVAAGAEDAAIVAQLTTSETCFDVSSAAMLDLRNAGVRPRVIQAMVRAARREEH